MNEVIHFKTKQEQLFPSNELVKEVLNLLNDQKKEVVLKLPQLSDLPFSIKLSKRVLDKNYIPSQSINAMVVNDITGEAIPFLGLTATIEWDGININIGSNVTNLTREDGFKSENQVSGATALFAVIDEAVAEAASQKYDDEVVRKEQTEVDVVKSVLKSRNFTKVNEAPNGNTWWEKKYSKRK